MATCRTVTKSATIRLHTEVTDPALPTMTAAIAAYIAQADAAAPTIAELTARLGRNLEAERLLPLEDLFPLPVRKTAEDELADTILNVMAHASNVEGVIGGGFTITNPAAIRWARQHAGALIVGIRDQQRTAVQWLTSRALGGEMTAEQLARRVRNVVGLTPTQARQLYHLEAYLDGLVPDPPASTLLSLPKRVTNADQVVDRFRRRLLAHRAETIARTEVERAAHRGLLLNWHRAADNGMFRAATATRRWVVTPDDRLCPQCRAMQGQTVSLDTPDFTATEGYKTPVFVATPPLHPRCRCTMVLDTSGPMPPTAGRPVGEDDFASWKPEMTRAEADRYTADSAIPGARYHGTNATSADTIRRDGFSADTIGDATGNFGQYGKGYYFTSDPAYAQVYAGATEPLEVRLLSRNPIPQDEFDRLVAEHELTFDRAGSTRTAELLREQGFDGLRYVPNPAHPDFDEIVVFDHRQIVVVR